MTKAELVEEVARAAELNKRDAEVIVETVFDSIIGALHNGQKVELRGFGSFRTRERGPRRGRNPKTGEPVDVPAKRVPYFKPGKELKEFFTDTPDEEGASSAGDAAASPADGASASPASASPADAASASPASTSPASAGDPASSEKAPETDSPSTEAAGGSSHSGSGA